MKSLHKILIISLLPVFNFPAIVRLQSLILKEYKNVEELLDFRYLGSQNLINHIETSLDTLRTRYKSVPDDNSFSSLNRSISRPIISKILAGG